MKVRGASQTAFQKVRMKIRGAAQPAAKAKAKVKKCSKPRCRNNAASPRAKFCIGCFKDNARCTGARSGGRCGGVVGNKGNRSTGEAKRFAGLKSAERRYLQKLPVYDSSGKKWRKLREQWTEKQKMQCDPAGAPAQADEERWHVGKDWKDMSVDEQAAVTTLGWTEATWTDGSEEPFARGWEALSVKEQQAARLLGFSPADFSEAPEVAQPAAPVAEPVSGKCAAVLLGCRSDGDAP